MKQSTIIRAFKALNNIYGQKTSLSVSHKLWTLRQKLAPQWDFQTEKEQEVIQKYEPDIMPDGTVKFKSKEDEMACMKEYAKTVDELSDIDVDMDDYKKIILHLDDKLELSIEDMEALSEFIDFVE